MPAAEDAQYVTPDQLCVGLYIHLDLSWLDHSFRFNSFKIKSEDQIKTLRSLKLKRIRYAPDRSDSAPYPLQAPTRPAPSPPPEPEAPSPAPEDAVQAEKRQRIELLKQHRQSCQQIEKAYLKASGVMRNISKSLMSNPRETMQEVNELVGLMARTFLDKSDVTLQVLSEKPVGEEVYYHSLNVSILSLMLAKSLGLSIDESQVLGCGALLHDIGLTEIPDRVLRKVTPLTQAEDNLRRMHCEYGVEMGRKLGLSEGVLRIIAQHHEVSDGSGYPKGLREEAIDPLARIVAIANCYDNLCNPIVIQQALTPHEALSQMFAQQRKRFDAKVLQLMIRNLGVYPPGSIVRLSNEALAMVSSVNTSKPMRPWVVVYEAGIPSEEAIMLNLEQEPDINISKALRPGQLPPEIIEYLSPRKRVTYYFDSSKDAQKP